MTAETHESVADELMFSDALVAADRLYRTHPTAVSRTQTGIYDCETRTHSSDKAVVRYTSTKNADQDVPIHSFELFESDGPNRNTLHYVKIYRDTSGEYSIHSNIIDAVTSAQAPNSHVRGKLFDAVDDPNLLEEIALGLELIGEQVKDENSIKVKNTTQLKAEDPKERIIAMIEQFPKPIVVKKYQWETPEATFEVRSRTDTLTQEKSVQLKRTSVNEDKLQNSSRAETWTFHSSTKNSNYEKDVANNDRVVVLFAPREERAKHKKQFGTNTSKILINNTKPQFAQTMREGLKVLQTAA